MLSCVLDYKKELEAIEEAEFEELKQSLCNRLRERVFSVNKLWRYYWDEVTNGTYQFDWKKKSAEATEELSKEAVLSLYSEGLEASARRLLVLEYGKQTGNEFYPAGENAKLYTDEEFRALKDFVPKQWVDYADM